MRSSPSRCRLRSQAAITPERLALDGSTLHDHEVIARAHAVPKGLGQRGADDLLGATVAVHLGAVDQAIAEFKREPDGGDLGAAGARRLAQAPGAQTEGRPAGAAVGQRHLLHDAHRRPSGGQVAFIIRA